MINFENKEQLSRACSELNTIYGMIMGNIMESPALFNNKSAEDCFPIFNSIRMDLNKQFEESETNKINKTNMNQTIFKKVQEIISEKTGISIEDINPESNITKDLDLDSLDFVELIMELEKQFHIAISDEEAEKHFTTIESVVKFLENKVK